MNVTRLLGLGILAVALGACGISVAADEEVDTTLAMSSAQAWIALIDRGQYGESWDAASETFRSGIDRAKWITTVDPVRAPLGGVIYRKVRQAQVARTLPGAPEADYVVIQFDTRFENRPLTTEVVTPVREKDGSWRVAGYVIR
jgi:Ethanolamine utilization protein EutJ (predicted chaperonin)